MSEHLHKVNQQTQQQLKAEVIQQFQAAPKPCLHPYISVMARKHRPGWQSANVRRLLEPKQEVSRPFSLSMGSGIIYYQSIECVS